MGRIKKLILVWARYGEPFLFLFGSCPISNLKIRYNIYVAETMRPVALLQGVIYFKEMLPIPNRQFYTYKIDTAVLREFNYELDLTFEQARKERFVIALSDNQILRSIRDIRGITIDYDELERLYSERDWLKRQRSTPEKREQIRQVQESIRDILFVEDYVTIVVSHPAHYKYIFSNGITINGKQYKRFSCSAGQARKSNVVLINTEIIDELSRRLNNGRDLQKPLSPSKFNAYFGLAGSATKIVSEPRFIVVKDFENETTFDVNYVTETEWDIDDIIERRTVTLPMNRTDGMGLISPRQSQKWAGELGLDYIPAQWCLRQSFTKGMLCTFPIHEFCEEVNGGNYIVDTIYKDDDGNYIKADLRDYDVIISESQFKLWDSYSSVESYLENCHKNHLYWGVSQYTPKVAKDVLKLNYQFIQTLDLDQDKVERLASQFVDWIRGVSYDNPWYMLLFLTGVNHDADSAAEFYESNDAHWIRSLMACPMLCEDRYIKGKISDLIKTKLEKACLGDIFVDGNFQVLVSDPYGFMQHVCGLEVTGLLRAGEYYSNYWNERGVTVVDGMRSPLTYRSEHVVMHLRDDELVNRWYKYCYVGIILNYHGHEVCNFGGADFDWCKVASVGNGGVKMW